MFKFTIVFLAVGLYKTQAAVIKATELDKDFLETTTVSFDSITTLEPEATTAAEDDLTSTTTERYGGLSRDEEASILILDQTLLNPASADLIQTETQSVQLQKSAKLLLLSTPKLAEKPKQPEQNLEESEEQDELYQNITEIDLETTTTSSILEENEETTTIAAENEEQIEIKKDEDDSKTKENPNTESTLEDMMATTEKTTKLYPINDALYEDKNMSHPENPALVVVDQPKESLNSNLGSIVLEEPEADFVLVEADILEGSYADADSELHLQPIVQSVEIVPSSFDDPLLINYVQSW